MQLRKPPKGWENESTEKRVQWLKEKKGIDYSKILYDEPKDLKGIIENHVGYTTIPTALASPLVLRGDYAKGEFIVPVCTVEGALVYSLTRGMLATADEGITVHHYFQKISRAPGFLLKNKEGVHKLSKFIDDHFKEFKEHAESTSSYAKLVEIQKIIDNNAIVLELYFYTDNAAGQNMVTIASRAVVQFVLKNFDVERNYLQDSFIESGVNSDKKMSHRSFVNGRGHFVVATCHVREKTLRRLLNVTSEYLLYAYKCVTVYGYLVGIIGIQFHISNALAAIYLATGQDVACVAENAAGLFFVEKAPDGDGVLITQKLPSVTVGTVGGGTKLASQRRNLEIIGCNGGPNSSKKLAEIIVASTLCLELSLFCSIMDDTFTHAHARYGRHHEEK